jgi:hypothetical protein
LHAHEESDDGKHWLNGILLLSLESTRGSNVQWKREMEEDRLDPTITFDVDFIVLFRITKVALCSIRVGTLFASRTVAIPTIFVAPFNLLFASLRRRIRPRFTCS